LIFCSSPHFYSSFLQVGFLSIIPPYIFLLHLPDLFFSLSPPLFFLPRLEMSSSLTFPLLFVNQRAQRSPFPPLTLLGGNMLQKSPLFLTSPSAPPHPRIHFSIKSTPSWTFFFCYSFSFPYYFFLRHLTRFCIYPTSRRAFFSCNL